MYTLNKAKEEIDLIAKHTTDIAEHLLSLGGNVDAKLESFKTDIVKVIETKFAEMTRAILGETETLESSAVSDLGAKVSLLTHGPATPQPRHDNDQAPQTFHIEPELYDNRPLDSQQHG